MSDLEFLERDLEILERLLTRNTARLILKGKSERITTILSQAAGVGAEQANLKRQILDFIHNLGPLVTQSHPDLDSSLIDTYGQFERALAKISADLGGVKAIVFDLIKQESKANSASPHN
jgi:hypothetical protein